LGIGPWFLAWWLVLKFKKNKITYNKENLICSKKIKIG
jgi:hypothetical protein